MMTETFILPVDTTGWPERPTAFDVIASLTRAGNEIADGIPGRVTVNPPRPGLGRVNFPDAPPLARGVEVSREIDIGSWNVTFVGVATDALADTCGAELEMTTQKSTHRVRVFETEIPRRGHGAPVQITLHCQGFGLPPRE